MANKLKKKHDSLIENEFPHLEKITFHYKIKEGYKPGDSIYNFLEKEISLETPCYGRIKQKNIKSLINKKYNVYLWGNLQGIIIDKYEIESFEDLLNKNN